MLSNNQQQQLQLPVSHQDLIINNKTNDSGLLSTITHMITKKKSTKEWIIIAVVTVIGLAAIGGIGYLIYALATGKSKGQSEENIGDRRQRRKKKSHGNETEKFKKLVGGNSSANNSNGSSGILSMTFANYSLSSDIYQ